MLPRMLGPGEISLQGKVTAIGGLDLKMLGGIRDGVKKIFIQKIIICVY